MSEWKPGAVAVAGRNGGEFLVVRTRGGGGDYWSAPMGWPMGVSSQDVDYYRPLAVIDPERREQVERLVASLEALSFSVWGCGAVSAAQTALREFANPTPTKPEEPTGDGAVVRTAEGKRYVRQVDGWWRGDPNCSVNWAALGGDLTVLSEGVQP